MAFRIYFRLTHYLSYDLTFGSADWIGSAAVVVPHQVHRNSRQVVYLTGGMWTVKEVYDTAISSPEV
jgi:hypothetical protein